MLAPNSPYHKKEPAPPAAVERPLAPDFSYPGNPWPTETTPSEPPAAPAAPQPSPRARALAVIIAAPTQPEREDTPMEDAAAVPDLITPAPVNPESTPGSLIDPWAPTQEDESARRDTLYLRQVYPEMSNKFCLRALEEGHGDPATTIAWAAALSDADRVLGVIADAFPTATPKKSRTPSSPRTGTRPPRTHSSPAYTSPHGTEGTPACIHSSPGSCSPLPTTRPLNSKTRAPPTTATRPSGGTPWSPPKPTK